MPTPPLLNTLEQGIDGASVSTSDIGSPDSFNAVTATAPTYTNVQKHSGTLSMRWVSVANVQICQYLTLGSITGDFYSRIYLYLPSLPSDNNYYPIQLRTSADAACAMLRILSTGIIQGRTADNSNAFAEGTVAVATGQWVRIEWRVLPSTTVGTMEWRLYNNADSATLTDSASNTGLVLGANIDKFGIGTTVTAPAAITHYFDDIAVSTTGWIGTESTTPLFQADFENNSIANWDTNDGTLTPTIQTSIVYEGSRALKSEWSAANNSVRLIKNLASSPQMTAKVNTRRSIYAAETLYYLTVGTADFAPRVDLQAWDVVGQVRLHTVTSAGSEASGGVVSGLFLDEWEEWQLAVDASANPWLVKVWKDGYLVINTTLATAAEDLNRVAIGAWTYTPADFGIYHDALVVYDTFGYVGTPVTFPTTGILDTFTGSDETPVATNWSSQIWDTTYDFNGLKRASNALTVNFQGDGASSWYDVQTFGPDQEAYFTITQSALNGDEWRIGLRLVNPGVSSLTGYDVRYQSFDDVVVIYRWDDWNSATFVSSIPMTFAVGDKFGASIVGNDIRAWKYTGGVWTNVLSATDATYTTAGYIGVRVASGDATLAIIDDFGGGTVVEEEVAEKQTYYAYRRRSYR